MLFVTAKAMKKDTIVKITQLPFRPWDTKLCSIKQTSDECTVCQLKDYFLHLSYYI